MRKASVLKILWYLRARQFVQIIVVIKKHEDLLKDVPPWGA